MRSSNWMVGAVGAASLVLTGTIAALLAVAPLSRAAGPTEQAASAPAASAAAANEPAGLQDAKASDCFACHAIDHKVVGPAYDAVAKRYAGKGDAVVDKLAKKVIDGGSGNWGSIAMTPHPDLGMAKARTIVKWILTLQPAAAAGASAGATSAAAGSTPVSGKTYAYKLADGKQVTLDFPVFVPGVSHQEVTKAIFSGYEQYNSTCNRCHGDDAVGGAYAAPDLRNAISGGLTWQQFLNTAMAGRQDKGMPSWAGFYTPEQIRDIYEYVKGRQLGLVPGGRPPSAQD